MGPVGPWARGQANKGLKQCKKKRLYFVDGIIYLFRTAASIRSIWRRSRVRSSHMCQKTKDYVFTKIPTIGVPAAGRRRRRRKNLQQPPLPHPIAPRDQISRSGKPLTPM